MNYLRKESNNCENFPKTCELISRINNYNVLEDNENHLSFIDPRIITGVTKSTNESDYYKKLYNTSENISGGVPYDITANLNSTELPAIIEESTENELEIYFKELLKRKYNENASKNKFVELNFSSIDSNNNLLDTNLIKNTYGPSSIDYNVLDTCGNYMKSNNLSIDTKVKTLDNYISKNIDKSSCSIKLNKELTELNEKSDIRVTDYIALIATAFALFLGLTSLLKQN